MERGPEQGRIAACFYLSPVIWTLYFTEVTDTMYNISWYNLTDVYNYRNIADNDNVKHSELSVHEAHRGV